MKRFRLKRTLFSRYIGKGMTVGAFSKLEAITTFK
jgi:hypothetical protein